jgi:hypothetical protein
MTAFPYSVLGLVGALVVAAPAVAASVPRRVGACVTSTVQSIETRLVDASTNKPIPGSGSAVTFANGIYQVSYDTVPAIEQSLKGDRVRICLAAVPRGCPKGDDRGKIYSTLNLRTGQRWRLPDSEHSCGGA